MKKVSLLAAAMTLCATTIAHAEDCAKTPPPGCPKAFEGFFIGGNIGYGTGGLSTKYDLRIANDSASQRYRSNPRGVDGGVNVGYNQRLGFLCAPKLGMGLEFVSNWGSVSHTGTFLDNDSNLVGEGKFTVKRRNSLQVRGNLFYVICEKVAPKVFLGWDGTQWATRSSVANAAGTTFTIRRKKRLNAFLWGAGVDFLMARHFTMGIEYAGTAADRTGIRGAANVGGTPVAGAYSIKPQMNTFALTAKLIY